jgi:hypothetical protein
LTQLLRMRIESLGAGLTDRATLADLLDEILSASAWTRADFRGAVEQWIAAREDVVPSRRNQGWEPASVRMLRMLGVLTPRDRDVEIWRIAKKIGPTDFSGLVLAKGLELALLEEALVGSSRGEKQRYGFQRAPLSG